VRPEILIGDKMLLEEVLAFEVEAEGRRALEARGRFTIALPGGSIASNFFPRLARVPLEWSGVDFFWVDERAVPPTDKESNYASAYSLWLKPAGVPAGRLHRMRAEEPDLQLAARAYSDELTQITGTPPQLDFVLLGVGPDGHIASLFPGPSPTHDEQRLVEVVEHSPKPPPRRLTLTLRVLSHAKRVLIVALGESKAAAIRDGLDSSSDRPLGALVRRSTHVRLLLDNAAASLLARR
jgi:6-phosphogluconolactonase